MAGSGSRLRRSPVGRHTVGRNAGLVALTLALAAALAGCVPAPSAPAGSSPAASSSGRLPSGAHIDRDLSYGSDPKQRLDVYRPAGAHDDPVILMVHGGGWTGGDKANASVVQNKVAHYLPAGYVFVSVNYRLSPQVDPVTEAQDVASALAYTQAHASSWGADPGRVVLMGHSAGANLVSLIASDPTYAKKAGAKPWLGTISLDSAAYDVPQIMASAHLGIYDTVFGHDEALWKAASPALVLAGTPKPFLLVCSSQRADSCPQANAFATVVRSQPGRAEVQPVNLSHAEINGELGTPGALTTAVDGFLRSIVHPGG